MYVLQLAGSMIFADPKEIKQKVIETINEIDMRKK